MKWAKHQPKDGDTIMVCRHRGAKTYHWYLLGLGTDGNPELFKFDRPDGTIGESSWCCICDICNQLYSDNPRRAIRGERIWMGNDPVIPDTAN